MEVQRATCPWKRSNKADSSALALVTDPTAVTGTRDGGDADEKKHKQWDGDAYYVRERRRPRARRCWNRKPTSPRHRPSAIAGDVSTRTALGSFFRCCAAVLVVVLCWCGATARFGRRRVRMQSCPNQRSGCVERASFVFEAGGQRWRSSRASFWTFGCIAKEDRSVRAMPSRGKRGRGGRESHAQAHAPETWPPENRSVAAVLPFALPLGPVGQRTHRAEYRAGTLAAADARAGADCLLCCCSETRRTPVE
ncbi:hypothetical protein HPB50_008769 [Hyalomma asiaticum]|uniref:Uncharacterized protein n=1 Tax=Hyalomma asiaticum TaxID=266040 RepID=A0ACB7S7Y8_HYAAI|nr:hypothetical protein HPB50_008769 [Hyalomma asiaticum]